MKSIHSKVQEKSIPLGALAPLSKILIEKGIDPWPLFNQFGIKEEDFKNNLMPVPIHIHGEIHQIAKELTGCDHLGLLIGQRANLSNTGPLRFLVLNAASMRDALESLFHYGRLWYRGLHLTLNEDQGYAGVRMAIEGNAPEKELLQTAYLVATVLIMELILGKSWRPTLVRISYPKPKSAHLYEKFFKCPVWFGQSQHEMLFPQSQLDQKRTGHDDQLDNFLRSHLSELHSHKSIELETQVCQVIEELLPHGICTVQKVSEFFSIHRFTLYRYLNDQKTNFESLLDQTRKNKACKLLENPELSVLDIANQLGYEAQGNFTRAFKRWYGLSPREWRKRCIDF
ncbi:AraC family transcriptional regulator [Acinetobacter sp. ANC 3832]|uniref:AraC family transcriptional regulator n=1 Tax=Acinetobacter sp. ANC 3832 TaxID=1977874 RepID=UPI000A357B95|nr:AraC family transcriptional regulator [Acinetobacter sp. ANC 3832]OTG88754.1 AraC family transcriptional regulator [Acinetobacter sp. ANC 3832]